MNEPLLNFLLHFPPPATVPELWGEINSMRIYTNAPCADLPASSAELVRELIALEVAGLTSADREGKWRVLPAKREVKARQAELFA